MTKDKNGDYTILKSTHYTAPGLKTNQNPQGLYISNMHMTIDKDFATPEILDHFEKEAQAGADYNLDKDSDIAYSTIRVGARMETYSEMRLRKLEADRTFAQNAGYTKKLPM